MEWKLPSIDHDECKRPEFLNWFADNSVGDLKVMGTVIPSSSWRRSRSGLGGDQRRFPSRPLGMLEAP